MHEVLVNRLGGLSLPRKSVVRLTDRPDMILDVYRGRKTTIQPTFGSKYTYLQLKQLYLCFVLLFLKIWRCLLSERVLRLSGCRSHLSSFEKINGQITIKLHIMVYIQTAYTERTN